MSQAAVCPRGAAFLEGPVPAEDSGRRRPASGAVPRRPLSPEGPSQAPLRGQVSSAACEISGNVLNLSGLRLAFH